MIAGDLALGGKPDEPGKRPISDSCCQSQSLRPCAPQETKMSQNWEERGDTKGVGRSVGDVSHLGNLILAEGTGRGHEGN